MDLEQGLLTRRSVRRFIKNRTVPTRTLHEILNMAMHAPSARDSRCWEFIVVDNKKIFPKIVEICPCGYHLNEASVAIFVCGNIKIKHTDRCWVPDTALALMQLSLACHAKDLGSCICPVYPEKDKMLAISNLLELPIHIEPLGMLIVGYKRETPPQPQDRYDIKKIHMNTW